MLNCTIVEGGVHCKLADDVAALQWTVKLLAVHALSTIARCHDEVAEVCRRVASVDRALREVDHGR